ncbi:unnamed protein product [Amaranthus hypochondriacus]
MWIPATLAKLMQGVSNVEELRSKITKEDTHDSSRAGSACGKEMGTHEMDNHENNRELTYCDTGMSQGQQHPLLDKGQEDDESQGWTPVAPGKAARRGQNRPPHHTPPITTEVEHSSREEGAVEEQTAGCGHQNGDGNPLIPSKQ